MAVAPVTSRRIISGWVSSRSGRTGDAARRSTSTSSPTPTSPATTNPPVRTANHEDTSRCWFSPTSTNPSEAVSTAMPAMSSGVSRPWLRPSSAGSTRATTAIASRPSGTFTRNTHRQPTWSVRRPPIIGPAMKLKAMMPASTAWAVALRRGPGQLGDQQERERLERSGAGSLHRPEGRHLPHRLRDRAERGAEHEQAHPDQQHALAAVAVGQAGEHGQQDGGGHEVRRDPPDVPGLTTQVADDLRQRGADDGLVEHGQEQAGEHGQPQQGAAPAGEVGEFVHM